jgi:RimJ/RimL family protein N-acetyltransferase
MVSINLATVMDLRGQAAADAMPQNHFSDVTGMVDFHRGASMAPDGKSIIVIPAAGAAGGAGNIVPEIAAGAVTLPACDVTHVVSEYGTVNLFGKNIQERALAMISIAHPSHRETLFSKAREMGLIGAERTIKDSVCGIYPAWIEETVELGGEKIRFRPAKPVDGRLIQEHFYELDQKDVAQRFFGERRHFHWDEVDGMFMVDYARNFSVVAFTGEEGFGRVVGIGSFYREEGRDKAEVAYSVSKRWQGKGVAATLQRKLVEAARENGLSGFYAITNANNISMVRLFKRLPYKVVASYDDGCVEMSCRFDTAV